MQTTKTERVVAQLEKLVDAHSLYEVLMALEVMCYQKEDHTSVNWQDRATAKTWGQDARSIHSILEKIQN